MVITRGLHVDFAYRWITRGLHVDYMWINCGLQLLTSSNKIVIFRSDINYAYINRQM